VARVAEADWAEVYTDCWESPCGRFRRWRSQTSAGPMDYLYAHTPGGYWLCIASGRNLEDLRKAAASYLRKLKERNASDTDPSKQEDR
jgi:hypothetical protein